MKKWSKEEAVKAIDDLLTKIKVVRTHGKARKNT